MSENPYAPPSSGAPQQLRQVGDIPPENLQVKPANFSLWLGLNIIALATAIGAGITLFIGISQTQANQPAGSLSFMTNSNMTLTAILGVICAICSIAGCVYACIILHRMWHIIQSPEQAITPGRAVGYLFVPFFNLYWVFVAYWNWSKEYNQFVVRYQVPNAPRMPEGLFLGFVISILAYNFIGCPALLPYAGFSMFKTYKAVEAINCFHALGQP